MTTVLFVHGTGVREKRYNDLFKKVEDALKETTATPARCFWGDEGLNLGAKLYYDGASIPNYNRHRGMLDGETTLTDVSMSQLRWQYLYTDPYFELRLLSLWTTTSQPTGAITGQAISESVGHQFDSQLANLAISTELEATLASVGLSTNDLHNAINQLRQDEPYKTVKAILSEEMTGYRAIMARAVLATMLHQANTTKGEPLMIPTSVEQQLEALLIDALQGGQRKFGSTIIDKALSIFRTTVQPVMNYSRPFVMDQSTPFAGDIVRYQGRHGKPIRDFIKDEITKAEPPVVILAHSLGAIMCTDVLVSHDFGPQVAYFISVGTQVPLIYEIDALHSLEYNQPLPPHFPPWLNIYDPADLLSFTGQEIFHQYPQFDELKVNTGKPFPLSHSAYWDDKQVWDKIREVLPK